ncbi:hypothetical protein ACLB2K_031481 [Fragaria x ananassa]
MVSHGYKRTDADPCVYICRFARGNFIILLLYVDDMLIVGQNVSMVSKLKEDLSKSFDNSLMYAMVCTRLNIAHAVGVVSRYLSNSGSEHWEAVKWILKYLRGTSKLCLSFGGSGSILEGFTDADLAGDLDNIKSTSGYLFTFCEGAVSWQSKLQKCVALSTTEAEYIEANEAGKKMLWLQRFIRELGVKQERYVVHCDSQSAIHLSKNSVYHPRTKHIDLRYHWIRDVVSKKLLRLKKIHTDKNTSNMLTKVVPQ